ncbi:MAG TPA: type IX secretion system outer membrane channel protein PorV [Flavobacteriaceae bacterium]|nr:type IX secretion system outer membrane channel protein PorV [Flavobacteriaceae bacterium]MCB9212852.1 type IX secretion system outer membrane channel protein PorV [Alteromonas sp.]HPF11476.1 type IX secretion system outer membrane channel protein PorV [Flavobacteriaceae bacterium]HQU20639.1 type IX secretion system outer membrane channel protein PorV [Flavobacteriaceae bacterium]HQU65038.1 type IX secretion system outer membrane channel protein PorV [Flavobacteriaceae bacterium]
MKQFFFVLFLIPIFAKSQTTVIIPNDNDSRVITTGVPFLLISADPRSAGMGDIGVATSADGFSQQWNPSKYAFSLSKQGVGVTYTPYLSNLVNDIFLGNLTYYNRINERSAVAGSFRYFSLGDIELRETFEQEPLIQRPNEFTFDLSYALRLSDRFSMAVSGRYLRSDLKIQASNEDASAAGSFGVDVSGYYQSEEVAYSDFNGRWRAGFNISNIGPKIKYDEVGQENFIPTNLGLGGGFDFIFDEYNKVGVNVEFNKLLVPTPPKYGTEIVFNDLNNNGTYEADEDEKISQTDNVIIEGKDNDVSFISGVFQSFGDAPGGFSEELKEFTWALGAEYWYQDVFAFRAGYFNESEDKGSRKFLSLGAGFKYTAITIDLSYLFSTSQVRSPLEGTLRFGLTFSFGDEYDEY